MIKNVFPENRDVKVRLGSAEFSQKRVALLNSIHKELLNAAIVDETTALGESDHQILDLLLKLRSKPKVGKRFEIGPDDIITRLSSNELLFKSEDFKSVSFSVWYQLEMKKGETLEIESYGPYLVFAEFKNDGWIFMVKMNQFTNLEFIPNEDQPHPLTKDLLGNRSHDRFIHIVDNKLQLFQHIDSTIKFKTISIQNFTPLYL